MSNHFGRDKRLLNPHDFKRVFDENSTRLSNAQALILVCPQNLPVARLGLIVSKKNVRRSVDRNRLKRRIRETFRSHQEALVGHDVVFMVRRDLGQAKPDEVSAILLQHWQAVIRRLSRVKDAADVNAEVDPTIKQEASKQGLKQDLKPRTPDGKALIQAEHQTDMVEAKTLLAPPQSLESSQKTVGSQKLESPQNEDASKIEASKLGASNSLPSSLDINKISGKQHA